MKNTQTIGMDFTNDFKEVVKILKNFVELKPVYKNGVLVEYKGTSMKKMCEVDRKYYSTVRLNLDMVILMLDHFMANKYSAFKTELEGAVVTVSVDEMIRYAIHGMSEEHEYLFESVKDTNKLIQDLATGIRYMATNEIIRETAGMTEETFNTISDLVIEIDNMNCMTNTYHLAKALKDKRISNRDNSIDPAMLIFYTMFSKNKNLWMNFSCEGHTVGDIVDGVDIFKLDEGNVILDYSDKFDNDMEDIIENVVNELALNNPTFKDYQEDLNKVDINFNYDILPAFSSNGWNKRVNLTYRSPERFWDVNMDCVSLRVVKIQYCLYEICKGINKATIDR